MKTLAFLIQADARANRRNPKGLFILACYRLAHAVLSMPRVLRPFGMIYVGFYKLLFEYVVGTELHWRTSVGPGAIIYHGYGLVVNSNAVIGARVVLRHNITIGAAQTGSERAPVVGDDVDIGAGAILVGAIRIGDGARIGAGAIVTRDVPPGATAVGNPARVIDAREPGAITTTG